MISTPPDVMVLGSSRIARDAVGGLAGLGLAVRWVGSDLPLDGAEPRLVHRVMGNPLDEAVLARAGMERAGAVIAAESRSDACCVLAVAAHEVFGVRHVALPLAGDALACGLVTLGIDVVELDALEERAFIRSISASSRPAVDARRGRGSPAARSPRRVVVAGVGTLAARLSARLERAGEHVLRVDAEVAADPETLRRSPVAAADLLVAAAREDDRNLAVALAALRLFSVQRVVARVDHPAREALFRESGVETVCVTRLAVQALLAFVQRVRRAAGGHERNGGT